MDEATGLAFLVALGFAVAVPLWLPVTFAAYAFGRRRFSLRLLLVFVTLEALSIGTVGWALRSGLFEAPITIEGDDSSVEIRL